MLNIVWRTQTEKEVYDLAADMIFDAADRGSTFTGNGP
jgi:hypothetical protein